MSGIKHIYRSIDAFRLPTYNETVSYSDNSIVAYRDSEGSKWSHFISITQTTAGSMDSDIRLNEWVQFSFDSDTLVKLAQKAIDDNFDSLTKNIDSDLTAKYDSDMSVLYGHLDSELNVFEVRLDNLFDSEWITKNITEQLNIADMGADSDWVLRLFGSKVTFSLLGADSEWVLSQIPDDQVDSEWVISQIQTNKLDSEWVLGLIKEYQNDSDWIESVVAVEKAERIAALDSEAAVRRVADDALSNRVTLLEIHNPDSEWVLSQIPEIQHDSDWITKYVTMQNRGADSDWVLRLIGDTLEWDSDIAYIRQSFTASQTDNKALTDRDSEISDRVYDNDSDIFVNQQLVNSHVDRFKLTPIQLTTDVVVASLAADSELDITTAALGAFRPEPYCYPDIKVFYSNQGNAHPTLAGRLLNGTKTTPLTGYRVAHNDSEISGIFLNTNSQILFDIRVVSTFRTQ